MGPLDKVLKHASLFPGYEASLQFQSLPWIFFCYLFRHKDSYMGIPKSTLLIP